MVNPSQARCWGAKPLPGGAPPAASCAARAGGSRSRSRAGRRRRSRARAAPRRGSGSPPGPRGARSRSPARRPGTERARALELAREVAAEADVADADRLDEVVDVIDQARDRPLRRVHDERQRHQADDAVALGERAQLVVAEVARGVADGAAERMADEHRPVARALEHLGERALVGVREVERDRQPGHAIDERAADLAEPSGGRLGRAVGERVAAVPGQRGHAHAERAEHVDQAGVVAERLHALEREHEAEAAGLERGVQVGGRAHRDRLRGLGDRAVELGDAEQRLAQRQLGQVGIVRVERADLEPHAARLELRQPAVREWLLLAAEEHELHEQVAVRVREPQGSAHARTGESVAPFDSEWIVVSGVHHR